MKFKFLKQSVVVAAFGAFSSVASAGLLVGTFDGNDCPGVYGGPGFSACVIPANADQGTPATPSIIKFDFNNNGDVTSTDISSLFPTIDGSEFSFDFGATPATGTWTYTPGAGDPGINYFTAFGGSSFNLFRNVDPLLSGDWSTPLNPGDQQAALSHLTFYDTMIPDQGVPEPASLALLGLGLAGLALVRRRKR